jgi:hypothetical protein
MFPLDTPDRLGSSVERLVGDEEDVPEAGRCFVDWAAHERRGSGLLAPQPPPVITSKVAPRPASSTLSLSSG